MKSLADLKGLGQKRLAVLAENGITDLKGLLSCLPRNYLFSQQPLPIAKVAPGEVCVQGSVLSAPTLSYYGGRSIVRLKVGDESGVLQVVYFNQSWMAKQLITGQPVLLYGLIKRYKNSLILQNPKILSEKGFIPQYKPFKGLPSKVFASLIDQALDFVDQIKDPLPGDLLSEKGLAPYALAMRLAHRPSSQADIEIAQRRLAFENLLFFQLAIRNSGLIEEKGPDMAQTAFEPRDFWAKLPFTPTGAQEKTLNQIIEDMKKPVTMRRLVQGDVGSGKTAVAFGAAVMAIKSGYQCAFMAPTELLARQHYQNAQKLFSPFGITCALLLGRMKAAQRRETLSQIANGTCQFIIGTHAVISPGVHYFNLGLTITDEQHRFGVRQRQSLAERAKHLSPHILAMSATPIPRSLALVLYGDLKISIMDELPPGRTPVKTRIVPENKRADLYRYILAKANSGEQSYLVCPLVSDSEEEDNDKKSAVSLYEQLKKTQLKGLGLALTYGSQPDEEKNQAMEDFYSGKAAVLVSTTVIEVGVDVPNATTMVIENADNFGLAQLHQLRGRVGRGQKESWCFLLGEENARLSTLVNTNDGFEIAREDLEQRGPGEFLGTRQHGRLLNVYGIHDMRLVEETSLYLDEQMMSSEKADLYRSLSRTALERFETLIKTTGLH